MSINIENAVLDKGVGYLYVYAPRHKMANAAGKVYIHRYVAQEHYGIELTSDMIVHHKDENKLNNDPSNLVIMSYEEHGSHHHGKDCIEHVCKHCKGIFLSNDENRRFCTKVCSDLYKQVFVITKDSLQELVDNYPISHIAKLLGVSDVAVHKRCKKLGVIKKPVGYWLRKQHCNS